jgi:hypothetical protein
LERSGKSLGYAGSGGESPTFLRNYITMYNPIGRSFNWKSLYDIYDKTSYRFDPTVPYLYIFTEKPKNDRFLYYMIVKKVKDEMNKIGYISLGTYEAILYWKLCSQPAAVANVCKTIRNDKDRQVILDKELRRCIPKLPKSIKNDVKVIKNLYDFFDNYGCHLFGVKNSCSLPTRSTLFHFLYPETVPIFDKQVLLAVGVTEKDANQNRNRLYEYTQFVWEESIKLNIPQDWPESPIRLFDMALWVIRGTKNKLTV